MYVTGFAFAFGLNRGTAVGTQEVPASAG